MSETAGRLFRRAKERHVFLYEKVVILSKKITVNVQRRDKKSDKYIYKDHLQVGAALCHMTIILYTVALEIFPTAS